MQVGTSVGEHRPRAWIIGGGGLQLRIPLMRLLEEHGFEMSAVGPGFTEAFAEAGFAYHRFPLRRALNPLADYRAGKVLHQLFLQHRPDLVHCVNTKPTLLVPPIARRNGVAGCVRTITGLGALFSSSSPLSLSLRLVYRQLQRKAERDCDFTVFQNPNDRDYFRRHHLSFPGRDAVVLGSGDGITGLRDSKLLSSTERLRLYGRIVSRCLTWSIGKREPEEIDHLNIHRASLAAMRDAVESLKPLPDFVLVDAFLIPGVFIPQRGIVGGDRSCAGIAAASIVAKVTRDRWMTEMHELDPRYGFDRHKGYATAAHLAALKRYGYSRVHRRSFRPRSLFDTAY